jgi:tellurite resistance protein TerC
MSVPAWAWLGFGGIVAVLLVVDVAAHWRATRISRRAAILWSAFWIGAGVLFGAAVWQILGVQAAHEYLAAYAMEKSLSLDNLFLFLVVFSTLGIEEKQQRRALYLGIAGALVLRGLFIWLGLAVLTRLAWVNWIFGAILLVAAVHSAREHPSDQKESKLARWLAHRLPVARTQHDSHLLVKEDGKRVVTPLLVSIIVIELADIAFAIDSVPAVLSITTEPFIVYSSNVFAILGLRSLYAVLEATIAHLRYLHWGIAAVLAFAAVKIVGGHWLHVPALWSVAIIVVCIGAATVASLIKRRRSGADAPAAEPDPGHAMRPRRT